MRIEKIRRRHQGLVSPRRLACWAAAATCAVALGTLGSSQAEAQQPIVRGSATPDYHVIREGDTIWDLSGSYYEDPYQWPRMWSYNPHITNPHWVYPGDIVYLKQVDRTGRQDGAGAGAGAGTGADRAQQTDEQTSFGMHLPLGGIIASEELEYVGRIIGSP
ncbi:MAG: LysM peptidoglycan-binding domain-containing protein, partial [Bradymonadaceae bacterium]